ncbi:MAG: SMUG2 DNA glycosylase family protein [Bacteroides sp.]|nr:SMUG2 DNA glycosylase family protein [Bacteroides sp.]
MATFGSKVIQFNRGLSFTGPLPDHIQVLNPFQSNPEINDISEKFYNKFYNDKNPRKLILGINPGRLGAGVTGIPFTDSKRMNDVCGIRLESVSTHEPSSVFIYDMIRAYGGAEKFYGDYYINSICPLGFIRYNKKGNWVNCNYYDDKELIRTMYDFMVSSLRRQISFGIDTEVCYILGKRNATFIREINRKEKFFRRLVELEHPRYIVQYKSGDTEFYLAKYLDTLCGE